MRRRHQVAAGFLAMSAGWVAFAGPPPKTETKPKVIVAPPSPDVIAAAVIAEQDAVLRRMDICDRLRRIGEETNNPSLIQQADELQKQVSTIYTSRVQRLGVKLPKDDSNSPGVDGASLAPSAPAPAGGTR